MHRCFASRVVTTFVPSSTEKQQHEGEEEKKSLLSVRDERS